MAKPIETLSPADEAIFRTATLKSLQGAAEDPDRIGAEYMPDSVPVLVTGQPLNATKGYQWVRWGTPSPGDAVTIDGSTFTYVASGPSANEFTTIEELAALIDARPNVESFFLDQAAVGVTALVAGVAGNSIEVSSEDFICTYATNALTPGDAPGVLEGGSDGTVADKPTYKYDSSGRLWFTASNTITQSNWRVVTKAVKLDRESDGSEEGMRSAYIPAIGELGYRSAATGPAAGYATGSMISVGDGISPFGKTVGPFIEYEATFGQAEYTGEGSDFIDVVGIILPAETTAVGSKIRLWGEIYMKLGAGLPEILMGIRGSGETPDGSNGFFSPLLRADSDFHKIDLDIVLIMKDSGDGNHLYIDKHVDRSMRWNDLSTPIVSLGCNMAFNGTPGNFHEPCFASDKPIYFHIVRLLDATPPDAEDYIYVKLAWDILN